MPSLPFSSGRQLQHMVVAAGGTLATKTRKAPEGGQKQPQWRYSNNKVVFQRGEPIVATQTSVIAGAPAREGMSTGEETQDASRTSGMPAAARPHCRDASNSKDAKKNLNCVMETFNST